MAYSGCRAQETRACDRPATTCDIFSGMYDAIVVGARVAGSSTAMLLGRRGYRVLLLEKAELGTDTMSTLYLQPGAMARLERWGLLHALAATGCPPIERWRWTLGKTTLVGFPWNEDGVTRGYAPRRTVLDPLLARDAERSGVELRTRCTFEDVVRDEAGAVVGVRASTQQGTTVVERARIVIGADGMRSRVAEAVGAPRYVDKPGLACGYYSFYSGVPTDGMEIHFEDGLATTLLPTNEGLTLVWGGWVAARFHEYRADIEGNLLRTLDTAGMGERVRAGRREERFTGFASVPTFFRQSHGDGWALVGDAGYTKDPVTAQGIADALRYAESLADAAHAGLSGARPMPSALADYQRARDERATAAADWTYRTSSLKPPSDRMAVVLGALAGNAEHTSRFMGLNACTVSAQEFLAPENLARIVATAGAA